MVFSTVVTNLSISVVVISAVVTLTWRVTDSSVVIWAVTPCVISSSAVVLAPYDSPLVMWPPITVTSSVSTVVKPWQRTWHNGFCSVSNCAYFSESRLKSVHGQAKALAYTRTSGNEMMYKKDCNEAIDWLLTSWWIDKSEPRGSHEVHQHDTATVGVRVELDDAGASPVRVIQCIVQHVHVEHWTNSCW